MVATTEGRLVGREQQIRKGCRFIFIEKILHRLANNESGETLDQRAIRVKITAANGWQRGGGGGSTTIIEGGCIGFGSAWFCGGISARKLM